MLKSAILKLLHIAILLSLLSSEPLSPIDCDFDDNEDPQGPMCGWKPDDEGSQIWHTGNAVIVDSAHTIVRSGKTDRFAFVQGHYGAPSQGSLISPILRTAPGMTNQIKFLYWKSAFEPILDICIKTVTNDKLECIDAIVGGGEEKWVLRKLNLPNAAEPFNVVFRARNINAAEDMIGIDDVRLIMPDDDESDAPIAFSNKLDESFETTEPPVEIKKSGLQFSSFEMRRSQPSVIRPRSRGKLIMDEEKLPIQEDDNKPIQLSERSFPHEKSQNSLNNFPDFPSFDQTLKNEDHEFPQTKKVAEETFTCKAVKCTFLDTTCMWILGEKWMKNDGNVGLEVAGFERMTSGPFKVPDSGTLEFDLSMSDDAKLNIYQNDNDNRATLLFSRQGEARNGWHRFRVPLHITKKNAVIRTEFTANLPENAFLTLSNTRLVDSNGDELGCETIQDTIVKTDKKMEEKDSPVGASTTIPLAPTLFPTFPPPFFANPFNPFPQIGMPFPVPPPQPLSPFGFPQQENVQNRAKIADGITPITPMKGSTTRLTAFQDLNEKNQINPFTFPTFPPMPAMMEFPTFPPLLPPLRPQGTTPAPRKSTPLISFTDATKVDASSKESSTDFDLMASKRPKSNVIGRPNNVIKSTYGKMISSVNSNDYGKALNNNDYGKALANVENVKPAKSTGKVIGNPFMAPQKDTKLMSAQDQQESLMIENIVKSASTQPFMQQQLKFLASQFGFDSNALNDPKQIARIKQLIGPRLFSKLPSSVRSVAPPVAETKQNENTSNDNAIDEDVMPKVEPIRPVNVDKVDFDRVMKQIQENQDPSNEVINKFLKSLSGERNPELTKAIDETQERMV